MRRSACSGSIGAGSARPTRFEWSRVWRHLLPCRRRFHGAPNIAPGTGDSYGCGGWTAGFGRGSGRDDTCGTRMRCRERAVAHRLRFGSKLGLHAEHAEPLQRSKRLADDRIRSTRGGCQNLARSKLPHALHDAGRGGPRIHRELRAERLPAAGRDRDAANTRTDTVRARSGRRRRAAGPLAEPGLRAARARPAPAPPRKGQGRPKQKQTTKQPAQ